MGWKVTPVGMNAALWVVQVILALLFLWAGAVKLIAPPEALEGPVPLPGWFLRLIAVAEVAGALGLILPGVAGIRPGLTPLAAVGLVLIMVGAAAVTLAGGPASAALLPVAVGVLAAFVAWGRWRVAPLGQPTRRHAPSPGSSGGAPGSPGRP
jgi:hypothetical protein